MNLKEKRKGLLAEAQGLINGAKAAGRDLTGPETDTVESLFKQIEGIDAQLAKGSSDMLAKLSEMTKSDNPSPSRKGAWAGEVARRASEAMTTYGVKAITTGGIDIPQVITPIVHEVVEPTRVLDLLDVKPLEGNEFQYLRQTVRTSNAAVVADGATKPTSVYTWEEVTGRARVVAHLSEPIPLRYLADHDGLRDVLANQMAEDLYVALEGEALDGDGTGEHFTGLSLTSGIQVQPYTTDLITTLRKARTALSTVQVTPTAWVFNPLDLEAIDLLREDGATGGFLDGIDAKVFGNLPRVGSTRVPVGTAWLADWKQAVMFVREGGRLDADVSGDLFAKNQAKLRYEGRFGLAVMRPDSFVKVDLTAGV